MAVPLSLMIMISDKRYALNFIFIFIDIHGSVFVFENYSRKGGGIMQLPTAAGMICNMTATAPGTAPTIFHIPYSTCSIAPCDIRGSWQQLLCSLSVVYLLCRSLRLSILTHTKPY